MGGVFFLVLAGTFLTAGLMIKQGIDALKERKAGRRAVNAIRRRNRKEWKYRLYTCP